MDTPNDNVPTTVVITSSSSTSSSSTSSSSSSESLSSPFLIDYEPNSALFFATMTGDIEGATQALQNGASPNYRNSFALTPLHIACGGVGPLPMVDLLIKAGADINAVDASGWTPLLLVSSTGQLPLLNRLLEELPRINLHYCRQINRYSTIPPTTTWTTSTPKDDGSNWCPLTRAAFRGQAKTVERLLEVGANLDTSLTDGKTAEEWAHIHNHYEVLEIIQKYRQSRSHLHPPPVVPLSTTHLQ